MPHWLLSRFGAALAAAYIAFAIFVLMQDRGPNAGSGNWISLAGMSSYLVTLPISAPFELMGAKLDYKRNLDMGLAIGGCALIVYLLGAGLAWIGALMVRAGRG